MGKNGRIAEQGSLSTILAKDSTLSAEMATELRDLAKAEDEIDNKAPTEETKKTTDGKLILAEEIEHGHVGWGAGLLFLGFHSASDILTL